MNARFRRPGWHTFRRVLAALGAGLMSLSLAPAALAHGSVTGAQDIVQDYGVLLVLAAAVLIGAGVLAWVTFAPQEPEAADQDGAAQDGTATPPASPLASPLASPPAAPAAPVSHGEGQASR